MATNRPLPWRSTMQSKDFVTIGNELKQTRSHLESALRLITLEKVPKKLKSGPERILKDLDAFTWSLVEHAIQTGVMTASQAEKACFEK